MKRKALATTLIMSLLVSVLAGTLLFQNVARELIVRGDAVTNSSGVVGEKPDANVTIISPENKVYHTDNVTVAFIIESDIEPLDYFTGSALYFFLRYGCLLDHSFSIKTSEELDAAGNKFTYNYTDWESNVDVAISRYGDGYLCNATLTKLSEGSHNVTVWVEEDQHYISYYITVGAVYSTVQFNVDLPPSISILSPETKVYNVSDVPLDFTVEETFSKIEYSLDGQSNVTINGNTTLIWLHNGYHNVTVYATDESGNTGVSKITYFNVEAPFPTALVVAASVATVAVVGAVLAIYFKKRRVKSGG